MKYVDCTNANNIITLNYYGLWTYGIINQVTKFKINLYIYYIIKCIEVHIDEVHTEEVNTEEVLIE